MLQVPELSIAFESSVNVQRKLIKKLWNYYEQHFIDYHGLDDKTFLRFQWMNECVDLHWKFVASSSLSLFFTLFYLICMSLLSACDNNLIPAQFHCTFFSFIIVRSVLFVRRVRPVLSSVFILVVLSFIFHILSSFPPPKFFPDCSIHLSFTSLHHLSSTFSLKNTIA